MGSLLTHDRVEDWGAGADVQTSHERLQSRPINAVRFVPSVSLSQREPNTS